MSIPDLELTARLVGLPLPELWNRYVAVGGSAPLSALAARIAGELSWSPGEELFLAVALNDALIDESLVALDPFQGLQQASVRIDDQLLESVPSAVPEVRHAGSVWFAREGPADREALRARARNARVLARLLRDAAQEARRRVAASTIHPLVGPADLIGSPPDLQRVQRANARRLDAVLQAEAQILWRADAAGRMVQDSPTWRAFTGQSMAEWADQGWLDAVHPADRRHAEENWRACVAGDVPVRTHFRLWSVAANDWQLTRVRAVPVRSARGRTSGWVGTNTVIDSAVRHAARRTRS
jgi:PAS domain-containing protein